MVPSSGGVAALCDIYCSVFCTSQLPFLIVIDTFVLDQPERIQHRYDVVGNTGKLSS